MLVAERRLRNARAAPFCDEGRDGIGAALRRRSSFRSFRKRYGNWQGFSAVIRQFGILCRWPADGQFPQFPQALSTFPE